MSSFLDFITKTNCPDTNRAPKRTVYTISDHASLQLPDKHQLVIAQRYDRLHDLLLVCISVYTLHDLVFVWCPQASATNCSIIPNHPYITDTSVWSTGHRVHINRLTC